jgi:hypothetical protein
MMLLELKPGFSNRVGYMCIDQAARLKERRHGSEQFQMPLWLLSQGWGFFSESPRPSEIASAAGGWPIALDQEGLPLDQGVSLDCETQL